MPTNDLPEARDAEAVASPPEAVSADDLVGRHLESARAQLADARERLKAARRRVVQLEDAVANWERLAGEVHATRKHDAA